MTENELDIEGLLPGQLLVEDTKTGNKFITSCVFRSIAGAYMTNSGPMIPLSDWQIGQRISRVKKLEREYKEALGNLTKEELDILATLQHTMKDFEEDGTYYGFENQDSIDRVEKERVRLTIEGRPRIYINSLTSLREDVGRDRI